MFYRLIICLTIAFFSCSCKYRIPQEIVPICKCTWSDVIENRLPKDIVYVPLEEFEVKDNLFGILDTIIDATENCKKYYSAGIEFSFWSYRSDDKIIVCIENVNINCFNLRNCNGFFSYKGYPFYYDGIFFPDFFEKKEQVSYGRSVKQLKTKIKRIEYNVEVIEERGSYWYFIYENGKLKIMDFDDCGNRKMDR